MARFSSRGRRGRRSRRRRSRRSRGYLVSRGGIRL